jgi:hypothetical protein
MRISAEPKDAIERFQRFMISPEIVTQFFPIAVHRVSEMEKAILERGQQLLPQSRKDAEAIGVRRTDDVRIIGLDTIPLPSDSGLRQLAVQTGLLTDRTIGMTFRVLSGQAFA